LLLHSFKYNSFSIFLERPAFDTLVNEYKKEITLARKKFRTEQPESSKGSVKFDFSHTIFYESFENYPIVSL
jgi:hypothetical protein